MMSFFGAALLVLGFVFLISAFDLVGRSSRVFVISKDVMRILKDPGLDDLEKEKSMQRYSKTLFLLFFHILFICAVAVIVPMGIIKLMDVAGLLSLQRVLTTMLSWQFIAASSIVVFALTWILRRK